MIGGMKKQETKPKNYNYNYTNQNSIKRDDAPYIPGLKSNDNTISQDQSEVQKPYIKMKPNQNQTLEAKPLKPMPEETVSDIDSVKPGSYIDKKSKEDFDEWN